MLTRDRSETMTRDQMEAHLALHGWEQGYFDGNGLRLGMAGMRHAESNTDVYVGGLTTRVAIGDEDPITPATLLDEDFWKLALRVVQLAPR